MVVLAIRSKDVFRSCFGYKHREKTWKPLAVVQKAYPHPLDFSFSSASIRWRTLPAAGPAAYAARNATNANQSVGSAVGCASLATIKLRSRNGWMAGQDKRRWRRGSNARSKRRLPGDVSTKGCQWLAMALRTNGSFCLRTGMNRTYHSWTHYQRRH